MTTDTQTLKIEAEARLRNLCPKGETVYTILRHVSASGMMRHIDLYVIRDNKPVYISGFVARYLDRKTHKHGAVKIQGCGMDMGFALVYDLSMVLYSNEDGSFNADGAYALNHEWI